MHCNAHRSSSRTAQGVGDTVMVFDTNPANMMAWGSTKTRQGQWPVIEGTTDAVCPLTILSRTRSSRAMNDCPATTQCGANLFRWLAGSPAENHRRDALASAADDEHAVAFAVDWHCHATAHRREKRAKLANQHVLVLDRGCRIACRPDVAQDDLPQVAERVVLHARLRRGWRDGQGPQTACTLSGVSACVGTNKVTQRELEGRHDVCRKKRAGSPNPP
eukprot:56836-Rhodomonas_salina.3